VYRGPGLRLVPPPGFEAVEDFADRQVVEDVGPSPLEIRTPFPGVPGNRSRGAVAAVESSSMTLYVPGSSGVAVLHLELREPASAWSHGIGMVLALALLGHFHRLWRDPFGSRPSRYEQGKRLALCLFGLSLVVCYGSSALYHGAWAGAEAVPVLRKLDHMGIYVLIAGTYTPVAWALFRGVWRRWTLATVWGMAASCSLLVGIRGVLPAWLSTTMYLAMGWGVLFCYRELARGLSHLSLLPLPLGGVFYSVGALINLAGWPVVAPGVFGSHEVFHLFVIAGSACHVAFMFRVVVPAQPPADWQTSPGGADLVLAHPQGTAGRRLRLVPHKGGVLWARPYVSSEESRSSFLPLEK